MPVTHLLRILLILALLMGAMAPARAIQIQLPKSADLAKSLSDHMIGYAGGENVYSFGAGDGINMIDPSGLDGKLTLHATSSHVWLEYVTTTGGVQLPGLQGPNPVGTTVTYGTWDAGAGSGGIVAPRAGLQVNMEQQLKLKSEASKSATLDSKQEKSLVNFLNSKTADQWEIDCNCATFATDSWQITGQSPIDPTSATTGWLPAPWVVAKQLNPNAKVISNTGSSSVDWSSIGSSSLSGSVSGSSLSSRRSSRRLFVSDAED